METRNTQLKRTNPKKSALRLILAPARTRHVQYKMTQATAKKSSKKCVKMKTTTLATITHHRRRRDTALQCCSTGNVTMTATGAAAAAAVILLLINISCVECAVRDRIKTNLEAKVGSHAAFNCHVDFPYEFPIPYVVAWSKDDKKIFTWYDGVTSVHEMFTGRLNLVTNDPEYGLASVNLTSIRESDQGYYHCQVRFPNRSPSVRNNGTTYHLTVESGSLIKIPPVNQTLREGKTAYLHCVMKYPESSNLTWYKDGVPLHDIPDLERRSYISPDGSLTIDPTMMLDLGEYQCHVQSGEGEAQTAKAFLNIQYKAKVIYAPPELFLPYGQPAILDCHFRANPPLRNLRWEKDGLLYDSYNVPGVFYKTNGSLYFTKVDENHAGSYTCTPYNELGTDGPSPVISVIVLRPPIFTITPKPIYIQKLGEAAELPCDAIDRDGSNRPTIVWSRKNGPPLPADRTSMTGGNLTITGLVESDRGIYECSATNAAATVTTESELMIENIAPRPPYNLTANSSDTAITIRWVPDNCHLNIENTNIGYQRPNLEYTVWYRLVDVPEWRTLRILQKNTMEATIEHLLPGREYELMVLSQDKHGDGMFSTHLRFATQQSAVENVDESSSVDTQPLLHTGGHTLGPPWNITLTANQQGWLLHWEHPRVGLATLRFYKVRWWKEPEQFLIGSVETYDNYYQLRQLKEEATYKVQVVAVSIDNDHMAGEELTLEVSQGRTMRALLVGSVVGVIFLLCALAAFLYMRRNCLRHLIATPRGSYDSSGEAVDESLKDSDKMNNA